MAALPPRTAKIKNTEIVNKTSPAPAATADAEGVPGLVEGWSGGRNSSYTTFSCGAVDFIS